MTINNSNQPSNKMGSTPYTTATTKPNGDSEPDTFFVIGSPDQYHPSKWTTSTSPRNLPERSPPTNISILIIGAGPAGLMAALECWRKGHTISGILERNPGPNFSGDLIIIQPSALYSMRSSHWGDMFDEIERDIVEAGTWYVRHDGEIVAGPVEPDFNSPEYLEERDREKVPRVGAVMIRRRFYETLLRMVARCGMEVEYGKRVEKYFEEEEETQKAGVWVAGETERRIADLVIAADGFRSKSELLIAGEHAPTRSSGMSVYRTSFPAKLAYADPLVRERWAACCSEGQSSYEFWMGSGMHIGLFLSPDMAAFGITPHDRFLDPTKIAKESWDPDVDPEEVVEVLRRARVEDASGGSDWHPVIEALVRTAPKGNLIHWPLNWRDLRPEMISRGGRVIQIGDAAHSTIPSSAAGGTLAVEDAVTLASCLQLAAASCPGAGGSTVPLAAKVYNLLRYQRASCTQKMAFVNAQVLGGTTDWEEAKRQPEKFRLRYPRWLFRHDPEAYAYEQYGRAVAHLVAGQEFKNTNIPPGHNFVHWTLDDIQKQMAAGKRVEDFLDGDWS